MSTITLLAHFDGEKIQLDESYPLKPNTKLLVTVLPIDDEQNEWYSMALAQFDKGYSEDEPDYPDSLIKDTNPDYEGA